MKAIGKSTQRLITECAGSMTNYLAWSQPYKRWKHLVKLARCSKKSYPITS